MFEGSLVDSKAESTALFLRRNRWPAVLSFSAQAVIAATLIAVPRLHPELLPLHAPAMLLAPPPVPRAPQTPPPPQRVHASLGAANAPSAPSAPSAQRSILRILLPAAPSTVETPIASNVGTMTGGTAIDSLGEVLGVVHNPNVTVASTAPPATHTGPVRISNGVTAGMLLAPIQPVYPSIARAAHVEGSVLVRAIISRTGQIESAQVLSGSPMLASAALEAVQHAHYRPYLLNGQPTEVDTTITINFRLGS